MAVIDHKTASNRTKNASHKPKNACYRPENASYRPKNASHSLNKASRNKACRRPALTYFTYLLFHYSHGNVWRFREFSKNFQDERL